MIPAAFDYHTPASLDDALSLLSQHGDGAKVLAGGHSLLPSMKLRLASPEHLIDLGGLRDLAYVREEKKAFAMFRKQKSSIALGAMTRHVAIETSDLLREKCPLLAECAGAIGDVQVRNRGTLGGSLAHADPAADYPAAIVALGAEIDVVGPGGKKRTIAAEDFFVDLMQTALAPNEILTEVRVPPVSGAYVKLPQPASGFAVVGVAAVVSLDGSGKCDGVRVGVTGTASTAFRAKATEDELEGKEPTADALRAAAAKAADGVTANGDLWASADYRLHLTKVYVRRALEKAVERARGGV